MIKEIKNDLLGEKYYEIEHNSGLKILVMPKEQFKTSYALFGTRFGSADIRFSLDGREIRLPDGTAHFLEHKLFESEEKDAFELFAKTGARANAYTSFDRTAYLFSCSENFYENLKTLLNFVQEPYFTEKTIQKEQGIISQEIKMYRDNPDWQSMIELLKALYKNCAVNTDIAGSVESIAKITPDDLYSSYEAFYRPDNMLLCICGNVEVKKIEKICDECIKEASSKKAELINAEEPEQIVRAKTVKRMPVVMPIFSFGYKESFYKARTVRERLETIILNQILIGNMSPLYQSLLEEGRINEDFSSEYFTSRFNAAVVFSGTGENGELIKERFEAEVQRVKKEGIDKELFDCVKRDIYGTIIKSANSSEDMATDLLECYLNGYKYFDEFETIGSITVESLQKRLESEYDVNKSAISLILPSEE